MIERKYKCDVCRGEESPSAPETKLIGFELGQGDTIRQVGSAHEYERHISIRQVGSAHEFERHICMRCLARMRKLATANAAELNKTFPGETMSAKIKILLTASQTVYYRQVVEMTPIEWEKFKRTPEEAIGDEADAWLDKRDVLAADDIDPDSVSAFAVDAKNEAAVPTDEYKGDGK